VWYVAPLEMNEGTHWGQGYNQPTKGCGAEEGPISDIYYYIYIRRIVKTIKIIIAAPYD
jgi:hypothetical protein